jgi:hypothetical protein
LRVSNSAGAIEAAGRRGLPKTRAKSREEARDAEARDPRHEEAAAPGADRIVSWNMQGGGGDATKSTRSSGGSAIPGPTPSCCRNAAGCSTGRRTTSRAGPSTGTPGRPTTGPRGRATSAAPWRSSPGARCWGDALIQPMREHPAADHRHPHRADQHRQHPRAPQQPGLPPDRPQPGLRGGRRPAHHRGGRQQPGAQPGDRPGGRAGGERIGGPPTCTGATWTMPRRAWRLNASVVEVGTVGASDHAPVTYDVQMP